MCILQNCVASAKAKVQVALPYYSVNVYRITGCLLDGIPQYQRAMSNLYPTFP